MGSSAAEPSETAPAEWTLIDGEDPASLHPDDPEHWVAVYTELVNTTDRMLEDATARLAARRLTPAGQVGSQVGTDEREVAMLLSKTESFRERLRWWTQRGVELWTTRG